jgi:hypothetical protein
MSVDPGEVLEEARAAAAQGDHAVALERYEHFFDRSLLDQGEGHNYYGVRLSYCLSEWARLGEKYGPAKARLNQKAQEALAAFEETSDAEKFHDYQAISEKLGRKDQVLAQFVKYHESKRNLASVALRFMWDHLVEERRWDICAVHLSDPNSRYQRALEKYDQAMGICRADPSLGGERFENQIKGWYVRDVGNLLAVLKNTGQQDSAEHIEQLALGDMHVRGNTDLVEQARARAAL